jgi:CRISPR/Cas system-associated exonuclease Cas4 (RecB family)
MKKRPPSSDPRQTGRKLNRPLAQDDSADELRRKIDAAVAAGFKASDPTTTEQAPVTPPTETAQTISPTEESTELSQTHVPLEAPDSELPLAPKLATETGSTRDDQLSPEPLPARMLNEFVYCPRLFYYEFVEGVFVHNADTMRGAAIHTRVDSGSGAMPPADSGKPETINSQPSTSSETIHSRSVSLGSDRLGVTAKIDLVEVRAAQIDDASDEPDLFSKAEVCPVDYKAGAPRESEEGKEIWDADKMQLGLQCLLLRDNGYTCNEGIIYYRATKQRVRLVITPES